MNYTGPVSDNPETLLAFPTYHYICSISLSYFSSSPSLDISVLRFNIGRDFLSSSTEPPTTSQWSQWTVDYDVSEGTDEEYQLKILIEGAGVEGEAEEEDVGLLVVAVDNITLSFCLPCDFDLLPEPGNLLLTAPSALNLSLGHITNFSLTASSPLCPSLPLVFNIEAGKINNTLTPTKVLQKSNTLLTTILYSNWHNSHTVPLSCMHLLSVSVS